MNPRSTTFNRATTETQVAVSLNLDEAGPAEIRTGLGFLDHMLTALARHAQLGLNLTCTGDLHIDDHHTVEDCALSLGSALDQALGERRGIVRFGSALCPLDEALARCAIDLSGRPGAWINLGLRRERIGDVSTENLTHFFTSLATAARMTLHLDLLRGENDHHRAEAAFKAFALALRQAVACDGSSIIPSTKEVL